jgi:autotransporter-associated beta strand protein
MIGASSDVTSPGSVVSQGPLGTGSLNLSNGVALLFAAGGYTLANPILTQGSVLFSGFNSGTLNGAVSLASGTFNVVSPTVTTTLGGTLSGSNITLTKSGFGILLLSGTNAFTGTMAVNAGSLALSGGSALADATALNVGSAGAVWLNANETVASLAGAGVVALQANTLSLAGANNAVFSGSINGSGGLVINGSLTQSLLGGNGFSGGVQLVAGTLLVGNDNALGSGTFTFTGGSFAPATSLATTTTSVISVTADIDNEASLEISPAGMRWNNISGNRPGSLDNSALAESSSV